MYLGSHTRVETGSPHDRFGSVETGNTRREQMFSALPPESGQGCKVYESRPSSQSPSSKKGGPKAALCVKAGRPQLDQFAALLAGLSTEALSPFAGVAVAVDLMPCSRSSAIFRALSSLASGGT